MKMKADDYAKLRDAMLRVLVQYPDARQGYKAAGLSDERFRWDVLHTSKFATGPLYAAGLNDNHIDTALRRIVDEGK